MKKTITLFLLAISCLAFGQEINNFEHPENYETGMLGELGEVKEFGSGDKSMILLPGWGFDWTIFQGFIDQYKENYKIYAITFPGFGDTPAPPIPDDPGNFKDLQWTNGIIKGIQDLIKEENLVKPTLVSYFTYSNVIALRMALDNPDDFSNVIIMSGMAKFTSNMVSYEPSSLSGRIYYVEKSLGPNWFKSVTKETWDNGNFLPATFVRDSIEAKKYWDMMSSVPIPTMVRYLCEYYCTDLSLEYEKLAIPVLVVIPSFTDELLYNANTNYFASFFHYSWLGAKPANENFAIVTIKDSHAFIAEDQPEKLYGVIDEFLGNKLNRFQVVR